MVEPVKKEEFNQLQLRVIKKQLECIPREGYFLGLLGPPALMAVFCLVYSNNPGNICLPASRGFQLTCRQLRGNFVQFTAFKKSHEVLIRKVIERHTSVAGCQSVALLKFKSFVPFRYQRSSRNNIVQCNGTYDSCNVRPHNLCHLKVGRYLICAPNLCPPESKPFLPVLLERCHLSCSKNSSVVLSGSGFNSRP